MILTRAVSPRGSRPALTGVRFVAGKGTSKDVAVFMNSPGQELVLMQVITRRICARFLQSLGFDGKKLLHGLRVTCFLFFHALQQITKYPGYTGIMFGSPYPGPAATSSSNLIMIFLIARF